MLCKASLFDPHASGVLRILSIQIRGMSLPCDSDTVRLQTPVGIVGQVRLWEIDVLLFIVARSETRLDVFVERLHCKTERVCFAQVKEGLFANDIFDPL